MNPGALTVDAVTFGLVLVRTLAVVLTVPGLGGAQIPGVFKILLGAALAVLLFPLIPPVHLKDGPGELALAVFWEVVVGTILGTTVSIMVFAALAAGSAVDIQAGLANATLLDPGGGGSEPLLASFYQGLILLVMFASDAHLGVLMGLARSFEWLPLGAPAHANLMALGNLYQQAFTGFFAVVLALILPVMVGMLGVEAAIAFLSRTMPQVNMLLVAAPMRILAGWFLVGISLPVTLQTMDQLMYTSIRLLGGS